MDDKSDYNEIQHLFEKSESEKIITPEIRLLKTIIENSRNWIKKAENIQKEYTTIKSLQAIVTEAKSIPLKLPILSEIKSRYERAHFW